MSLKDIFSLSYAQLSLLLEGAYIKNNVSNENESEVGKTEDYEEIENIGASSINEFFGG